MKKILKRLPKISIVLGITFFILSLIVIEWATIEEFFYCEKVNWREMCGIITVFFNIPTILIFPVLENNSGNLTVVILLGFLSSLFWGLVGILLGVVLSFIKFLFKRIVSGSRTTKFIYLITGLILLSIISYFFAVRFLI